MGLGCSGLSVEIAALLGVFPAVSHYNIRIAAALLGATHLCVHMSFFYALEPITSEPV